MDRVYLNVKFAEKDEVKILGAKWDATKKRWYITTIQDKSKFEKWIEDEHIVNVKSHGFTICKGYEACWKCKLPSPVAGILLPKNHEMLDEDIPDAWNHYNYLSFVYYLYSINAAALKYISHVAPNYKLTASKTAQSSYYMNTCEHCGASLGDFHLYEVGGVFNPDSKDGVKAIQTQFINCEFYAASGGFVTSDLIDLYLPNRL